MTRPVHFGEAPRNLVLAASAGTGKTYALVGEILALLLGRSPSARGRDPSRIVATTFSRKAAAEIRTRVTQELERLGSSPASSSYFTALRTVTDVSDDAVLTQRARHALAHLGSARFGTLHSFATGIVRDYALECGVGTRFDLASEAETRAQTEDALARALERAFASASEAVRALVDAAGGIDRLVAQLRRLLSQLEEDGRTAQDLATATDDVVAIERTYEAFLDHARDLSSTLRFEAAARLVVDASGGPLDAESGLEAAIVGLASVPATGRKTSEVEAFAVFRRGLPGATNEEKGRRLARSFRARHEFERHASILRQILVDAEAELDRTTRARASLGFGQVLRAARELLRDRPDVAREIAFEIDALLVDEFQDTSRVQRDIVQLLWAVPEARHRGCIPPLSSLRPRGLIVVGDRKQSIYGFRGADVGVFAEIAVGLAGAPAREALGIPIGVTWEPSEPVADFRVLRHNRRSVPEILAFANAFSARRFRPDDPPPELFEIEYVPATEDLLVPPERSFVARGARTTWLRVAPKRGAASTRLEEALVIAQRIGDLIREGAPRIGPEGIVPSFRDVAVLATTNGMLDALAFALSQAGIPHVVAGKGFFRAREVRDLAAMLALVLDPSDKLAALSVLRGAWAAVHDETLLALTRAGEGIAPVSAWPALVEAAPAEDRGAVRAVASFVDEVARFARRLAPGALLREAVSALRLEEVLGSLPRGDQRVANMRKLLNVADRHGDPALFRRWLDAAAEQELAESEAATFSEDEDAVRLLTVHASKGLDFPIVFVPEIAAALPRVERGVARVTIGAGESPNVLSVRFGDSGGIVLEPPSFARAHRIARRRERAERQRLAYVAITRAAEAMYFVGGRAGGRAVDGGASTIAVLEDLAADAHVARAAGLVVEDVAVPPPVVGGYEAPVRPTEIPAEPPTPPVPRWRSLPIAPTALADLDHCARRFELIHVIGLPEHRRRRARGGTPRSGAGGGLDARAEGTLAHAVLERVPDTVFGGSDYLDESVRRALGAEGISTEHPRYGAIAARVTGFLVGGYAREIASRRAEIRREVAFLLPVGEEEGGTVVLRGSIDLVAIWPDGSVDVIDYKSARTAAPDAHAFQLDVYALAARALFPRAPKVRLGLVFLGRTCGDPVWRLVSDERDVRHRIVELGRRVVASRWSGSFPRVELGRCEAIHCGFIGRCHAGPPSNGTGSNASRVTMT